LIVDSSALLAICFQEAEHGVFTDAIMAVNDPMIGAPNLFEAVIVEARGGEAAGRELDKIVANLGLSVVAFDADHAAVAREAFRRFGRGRHRAALNFGDCCAYGLAKSLELALLFKGNDFALTDIKPAI